MPIYSTDIRHDGLHAYRRITGRDPYVVEQKAAAQLAAWDEKWGKIQQREAAFQSKEEKKEEAARKTEEAKETLKGIEDTLLHTLTVNDAIDWESLKAHSPFPKKPPVRPFPGTIPREPLRSDATYTPRLTFFDKIFSSLKQKKQAAAQQSFDADHGAWKVTKANIERQNEAAQKEWGEEVRVWEVDKAAFYEKQTAANSAIDLRKQAYLERMPDAIADYCDMVLANSEYPDTFPKSYRLDYNPETRLLLVEYSLPHSDALPRLKEVKYYVSRDEFTEAYLPDAAFDKLYDNLLYQITLRSIHELFEADVIDAIDCIVFNGWVNAVDKATGHNTNGCILSIQVNKQEFLNIKLAQIEPKTCFKKLKGVGSSKLAALVPIRPILQLDTQDDRFVPSHDVVDGLDGSANLAAMDWEEFEHLIREVFEKEFNQDGAEVKITRASRDGGVDAVVFDPDPLRGGKIVIQAKRYTNTVGLSAVRDLYGTVVNEGANKGILVTTADYGPDAYGFAKDKPLTLLNGSNLLHMLEKHGHRAKIDLREAKQTLKAAGSE